MEWTIGVDSWLEPWSETENAMSVLKEPVEVLGGILPGF